MTAVPAGRRGSDEPVVRQVTEDLVLVEVGGRKVLAAALCPHRGAGSGTAGSTGTGCGSPAPAPHDLRPGQRRTPHGAACAALRVVDVLPGQDERPEALSGGAS
ncbi:Rieske (2Fe-2S) protein [Streptomyces diastatochromogenes]|nr:Rieske (2Fe-2S) protein [Streptomyces diastatochromogenes]